MSRAITPALNAQFKAGTLAPILLVELEYDSGTLRLWNGNRDLTALAVVWTGAGHLLSVGSAPEGLSIQAQGMALTLTGIDNAIVSNALNEDYQGRTANIYLGALDANDVPVVDPFLHFSGLMDGQIIDDNGTTATITLSIESELISLQAINERRYTHEDQQIDFPGDLGLEFINAIQDKIIDWGGAGQGAVAPAVAIRRGPGGRHSSPQRKRGPGG